jgi:hypothetical protein
MPALAAAAKPTLVVWRSSVSGRPSGLAATTSAEPSLEALSTTTTRAGGGCSRPTARRQARSVAAWLYDTTTTA